MTDEELAAAVVAVEQLEAAARRSGEARDLVDREAAIAVVRLTVPVRRALETWIVRRATRAAARQS